MMFGLPILLDKSAIQSLNYASIETLTRHYLLVLPPILLTEIMSDLHSNKGKITTPDSELNTRLVQSLARKLITHAAVKNADYRDLCVSELIGENSYSRFTPCVEPTSVARLPDGRTGALIDDSVEMAMIHNWQEGNFTADEASYAASFRQISQAVDLNAYKSELLKVKTAYSSTSLEELRQQISDTTLRDTQQWRFLGWYCDHLGVAPQRRSEIQRRFQRSSASFKEFAPYTYHCYLVQMVFVEGLVNGLIPTSKKDKAHIDIQYFFYLPNVRVFSSKDSLHGKLWKAFGDEEQQVFVSSAALTEDLSTLTSFWQNLSQDEKIALCNIAPYPPALKDSPTFNVFEKMQTIGALMPRDQFEGNSLRRRTKAEEKAILDQAVENYRTLKLASNPHPY